MQTLTNSILKTQEKLDINRIIRDKKLTVRFQTIISLSRKMVIGLEGLIRGLDIDTNQIIQPISFI